MSREARIVIPGMAHHVVQRGNRRQDVFFTPEDRLTYLQDLNNYAGAANVQILSYCLMTNHVHLLLVPSDEEGLSKTLKPLHTGYAIKINKRFGWSGHLWQNRFFSCVLEESHFWVALRYVELNPVRAGMVKAAEDYRWSSSGAGRGAEYLRIEKEWQDILALRETWLTQEPSNESYELLRKTTEQNRALGSDRFLKKLQTEFGRPTAYKKRGRPKT